MDVVQTKRAGRQCQDPVSHHQRAEPADGLMPQGLEPGAGIEGLKAPEDYPALLAAMRARGWSEADVGAISCDSLLGFLRRSLPSA